MEHGANDYPCRVYNDVARNVYWRVRLATEGDRREPPQSKKGRLILTDDSRYYVVPGEQALMTMINLKETQDIASHFLKYYAALSEPKDWEQTCVPDIAELYSGSRACIHYLEDLMGQDPPPEFREKVTGGGLCLSDEQYAGLAGLIQTIGTLKKSVQTVHNISFEIH